MLTSQIVLAIACVVGALVAWPEHRSGRARLRALLPEITRRSTVHHLLSRTCAVIASVGVGPALRNVVIMAAGACGAAAAGPAGAIAALTLGWTGRRCWLRSQERKASVRSSAGMISAVWALAAETRAGAHPALAAEGAARDATPEAGAVLRTISATARLGGDVASSLRELGEVEPSLAGPVNRIARAWTVAERHGVALSDLLESVARDLSQRDRFSKELHARMAGPRATGTVLTLLPALGLLLGEATGARPLVVLTTGVAGQVLLVLGVALLCTGALWTVHLTKGVVQA